MTLMVRAVASKTVQVSISKDGATGAIPVSFDPKTVFGKVRAPVKVTVNGYTFRSTIARMGGQTFIPFRRSHREAASVAAGDRVSVKIESDTERRSVQVPRDLAKALRAEPSIWRQWHALSYTDQKECVESVESAKKPETRQRRLVKVVGFVAQKRASGAGG